MLTWGQLGIIALVAGVLYIALDYIARVRGYRPTGGISPAFRFAAFGIFLMCALPSGLILFAEFDGALDLSRPNELNLLLMAVGAGAMAIVSLGLAITGRSPFKFDREQYGRHGLSNNTLERTGEERHSQ